MSGLPAPRIRKLSEKGNVRQGFFSESEIRKVIQNLAADLQDFALFGWLTGMRKSEIASLAWEDVDGDVIRLRAENAKNGEARMIPLEGELGEMIERRRAARQVMLDGIPMISSLIFHRDGQPVGDFRKAWARACCNAGVGEMVCPRCRLAVDQKRHCSKCRVAASSDELDYRGRIFHDLRRSACRNMLKAGVAQTIAMKISGHKTDSMFRRYAIAAEDDIRSALKRTQEYLKSVKENVVAMREPTKLPSKGEHGQFTDKRRRAIAKAVAK
jgi:integrase